jgi:hypothetical protein
VALNRLLLAGVLRLARGHSLHASGLSAHSLLIDLALAMLGLALADFLREQSLLVLALVAPLLLLQRSLGLLLREQAAPAGARAA